MSPTPTPTPTQPPTGGLPPLSQHFADAIIQTVAWCVARPWLVAVPVVLLIAGLLGRAVIAGRRTKAMNEHAQLITITPPPEVDPAGAAVFWATLAEITTPGRRRRWREGRSHIAVEYRWAGRQLTIAVPQEQPQCRPRRHGAARVARQRGPVRQRRAAPAAGRRLRTAPDRHGLGHRRVPGPQRRRRRRLPAAFAVAWAEVTG